MKQEEFAWEEHERFITQDEIDAFLTDESSNGRLATYSYYLSGHTDQEKSTFLREHYGTGGRSHALSGADDSYADYSGKGIQLSRGTIGDPYAGVN